MPRRESVSSNALQYGPFEGSYPLPGTDVEMWLAVAVIPGAITMDFGRNVLNVIIPNMVTSFGFHFGYFEWAGEWDTPYDR